MWTRLPAASLLTRRIYIIVLILPGLILLHVLLQTSEISLAESYRIQINKALSRPNHAIDDRVGWNSGSSSSSSSSSNAPNRDSILGLGSSKSGIGGGGGSSWTELGQKLGKLTGVAAGRRPSTSKNLHAGATSSSKRTGGSIYELVNQSPLGLYDARTSLDKLRLTSTRFVGARPPSPYQVFARTPQRQHILVTGGFSSLGRSLVRDLLLLGGESGAEEEDLSSSSSQSKSGRFGLSGLWGSSDDDDESDPYADDMSDYPGFKKIKEADTKKGIIVTVLDTTNRSMELDDMLRHSPLYHRSRIGFNLPDAASNGGSSPLWSSNSGENEDGQAQSGNGAGGFEGTPPLEFIDPRSAGFTSSEVSLASFIAKGRLRIVKGDSRSSEVLHQLLKAHRPSQSAANKPAKGEKTRFGTPKRPLYEEDSSASLPPVSGVFHLAGYENTDCKLKNARDCADLERGALRALTDAVERIDESIRPWIVAGDRGNLEDPEVAQWLKGAEVVQAVKEEPAPQTHATPLQASSTPSTTSPETTQVKKRSLRWQRETSFEKRSLYDSTSYITPLRNIAKKVKLHALSLRLPPNSHIFGDSFAPRSLPIPHLVHSAYGHLPIVLDEDTFPSMSTRVFDNSTFDSSALDKTVTKSVWDNTGVVYIDDVVEAFIAAGELLSRASNAEYVSRMSMLAEVDIVPPPRAHSVVPAYASTGSKSVAEDTLDWIIQLTKSSSPVGFVQSQSSLNTRETLQGRPLDRSLARTILGTTPSTPLPLALKAYIRSLLGRQASFFDEQITNACAPPHALRTLNDALAQLDTCSVQLLGLVSGENVVLACNPAYDHTPATSPLILSNAVPYTEKLSQVKLKSKWGPVGKVEIGFFCPFGDNGADEQIVWLESTETLEGRWASAKEANFMQAESTTIWSYEKFEVNFVRRDMRSFTLSILQYPQAGPDAPKRRMVFAIDQSRKRPDASMKDILSLEFQLLTETAPDWQTMEWRVNPICCSDKQPQLINGFTFLQEDPLLTSQVLYPSADGSNSVAESTYELQRCRDLRSAHEYSKKLNTWNEKSSTSKTCPRSLSEGSDWLVHDLPICSINCDAPIACLVNDKCRCTRDRCGDEKLSDSSRQDWAAHSSGLSIDYTRMPGDNAGPAVRELDNSTASKTLKEQVDSLPWDAVIEPLARHVFSLPIDALPKPYMVELPEDVDTHMQNASCYDVNKAEVPTTADHYLAVALEERSVAGDEADFSFIPYYQGCYFNYLHENTYKKLADSVAVAETQIVLSDKMKASNIVVPFTHDWGSCTGWWPLLEDVLSRSPPPPMSKAISWQVNGDYNTRCVKAERDVVIPAVTKHIDALVKAYGDMNKITRVAERKNLGFFAGDVKGFGAFARTRIGCSAAARVSQGFVLYEETTNGTDYIGKLNESKFCLLPRGIAGWSNRAFEAMYAGCIPVFIADRTNFPFSSILSYSAFSVSVAENRIHELQNILSSIPDREVTAMQIALLKVRDAFIFSKKPSEEWSRRGPLYFTLVEMAQKLALDWPTLPVRNTCR